MSAVKSGSSLRALLLTPERIPSFFIPSRSPHIGSPWPHRRSAEHTRLLSDHEDDTPGATPPGTPTSYGTSSRFLFRFPPSLNGRPRCGDAAPAAESDSDTGAAKLPAVSLSHVGKVTTPHGFRAVSPSTSQVESLFHRNKPVKVTVTQPDPEDPAGTPPPPPGKLRVSLRPVKAFGLQVMKELKKPAAALKVLSTTPRLTVPR